MAGGLRVRPATPAEHAAVGTLTERAYRSLLGELLQDDYARVLRAVEGRAGTDTVLVAVEGRQLVGSVTYVDDPASPNAEFPEPADAGIRYLAVDPEVQRRGAGEALVRACVDRARAAGKARIVLHTQVEMAAAQRLYSRLGFARDTTLDWEPLPGVRLVGFVLGLRAEAAEPR